MYMYIKNLGSSSSKSWNLARRILHEGEPLKYHFIDNHSRHRSVGFMPRQSPARLVGMKM